MRKNDDLISRKALCEYALNQKDKSITPNDIMRFPSAQPEKRTHERTETHACDLISRQAAIKAMEGVDWYHINSNGQLVHGANSKEDEPLYKAEDVYKVLNDVPSAQPEIIRCKECAYASKDDYTHCPYVTWWNSKDDFCSKGKRRTDE